MLKKINKMFDLVEDTAIVIGSIMFAFGLIQTMILLFTNFDQFMTTNPNYVGIEVAQPLMYQTAVWSLCGGITLFIFALVLAYCQSLTVRKIKRAVWSFTRCMLIAILLPVILMQKYLTRAIKKLNNQKRRGY